MSVRSLSREDFPGGGNGNTLQYSCLGNPNPWGQKRVGHDWATKQQQRCLHPNSWNLWLCYVTWSKKKKRKALGRGRQNNKCWLFSTTKFWGSLLYSNSYLIEVLVPPESSCCNKYLKIWSRFLISQWMRPGKIFWCVYLRIPKLSWTDVESWTLMMLPVRSQREIRNILWKFEEGRSLRCRGRNLMLLPTEMCKVKSNKCARRTESSR